MQIQAPDFHDAHTCAHVHTCIFAHVHTFSTRRIRAHTHTCTRSHAQMRTRAHAHMRTRAHVHTRIRALAHTRTRAHTHTRTRAHAHTRTRAHAHTRTRAHVSLSRVNTKTLEAAQEIGEFRVEEWVDGWVVERVDSLISQICIKTMSVKGGNDVGKGGSIGKPLLPSLIKGGTR
jgi:hypothetical protein